MRLRLVEVEYEDELRKMWKQRPTVSSRNTSCYVQWILKVKLTASNLN